MTGKADALPLPTAPDRPKYLPENALTMPPIFEQYGKALKPFDGSQDIYNSLVSAFQKSGSGIPSPSGGWGRLTTATDRVAEHTRKTADNTRKLLDINRVILGGGTLGQLGVTPSELSGSVGLPRPGSRGGVVNVRIPRASSDMERVVRDIAYEVASDVVRSSRLRFQ